MALSDAVIAQAIAAAARGSWRDLAAVLTDLATVKTTVEDITATPTELNREADISASIQSITAAGAIDPAYKYIKLTGPAASNYAVTLAAPAAGTEGRILIIEMIATTATNPVTLALTNVVGQSSGTSASFDAAGEFLMLVARTGKWVVLKEQGITLS